MQRISPSLLVVLWIAILIVAGPALAQSPVGHRSAVHIPDASTEGTWDGTWFHISRDHRVALWARTQDGKLELRLQYFRIGRAEQFETDWATTASYDVDGAPGTFSLTVTEASDDQLEAKWDWRLQFADSGRFETADITIYRTGDGRQLVFLFEDFKRELHRGQDVQTASTRKTWTFRKASKRLILWDELPF